MASLQWSTTNHTSLHSLGIALWKQKYLMEMQEYSLKLDIESLAASSVDLLQFLWTVMKEVQIPWGNPICEKAQDRYTERQCGKRQWFCTISSYHSHYSKSVRHHEAPTQDQSPAEYQLANHIRRWRAQLNHLNKKITPQNQDKKYKGSFRLLNFGITLLYNNILLENTCH